MNPTPITDLHTEELLALLVARGLRPTEHTLALWANADGSGYGGAINAALKSQDLESQAGTIKEVMQNLLAFARNEPVVRSCMDFGSALRLLKQGRRVVRRDWLKWGTHPYIWMGNDRLFVSAENFPDIEFYPTTEALLAEDWILV